jgi:hypothetical protein
MPEYTHKQQALLMKEKRQTQTNIMLAEVQSSFSYPS